MVDETRRDPRRGLEPGDDSADPGLEATPEEAAGVVALLEAAWRPGALDEAANERLLAAALGGEEAAPSEAELREAEQLRRALEGDAPHPLAELAGALGAATKPADLPADRHEALLERALGAGADVVPLDARRRRARGVGAARPRAARVGGLVGGALALAAAVALFVSTSRQRPDSQAAAPPRISEARAVELAEARSTAELFDAPFAGKGGESERLDRINAARSADLRANRFASWGVR